MKIGDYVRTKKGIIGKLVEEYTFNNGKVAYPYPQELVLDMNGNKIAITEDLDVPIKSSPNIIDLIEVGDYVNGVIISQNNINNFIYLAKTQNKNNNYGIKSIVTKEQFEEMSYKL